MRATREYLPFRGSPSLRLISSFSSIRLLLIVTVIPGSDLLPSQPSIRSESFSRDAFIFNDDENALIAIANETGNIRRGTRTSGHQSATDQIFFPDDETLDHRTNNFKPEPLPECMNRTYCEKTSFYPEDYISHALKKPDAVKFMLHRPKIDEVTDIKQRFDGDEDTPLCQVVSRKIYPKSAQTKNNDWFIIVNQKEYKQFVKVEECHISASKCSTIYQFAEGYTTFCKQKYIYQELLALTPTGNFVEDSFRFPSTCCCHIKFDSTASRIGIGVRSYIAGLDKTPE